MWKIPVYVITLIFHIRVPMSVLFQLFVYKILPFFAVDHRVTLSFEALDFIPQSQNHTWELQTEDCESSNYIEFVIPPQSLKLCVNDFQLDNKVRVKR